MTNKHAVLGIALTLVTGCGGEAFESQGTTLEQDGQAGEAQPEAGPDALPGEDAGPDAQPEAEASPDAEPEASPEPEPEASTETGAEPEPDAGPEAEPEEQPEEQPEAGPEPQPEAGPDSPLEAEAAVPWDATDFDAFADGGQPCITGVDLPYCTNGSQAPWLVPMICSNNAWKPNAAEGECNYGCDTEGQCSCAAPVGRLLANIVSGPPQQRFITDTVTGYLWFFQPGWTGTMAQAEAFCAAGGYRIPWLDEAKTIMAQRLNAPYIQSVPNIHCKGKNTDPVISAASYWFKGHTDEWHQPGYGLFNPAAPSWTPVWQAPSDYPNGVICIKAADCHEGETRCAGTGTETCDASGHWQPAGACANGCLNGVCKCQLGEFRCSADPCQGFHCKADGSWGVSTELVCANVGKGCNPSTNQCDGIGAYCY